MALATTLATSCQMDTEPIAGFTQEQLNESEDRLNLLSAAVKRMMQNITTSSLYYNCGYPGLMLVRDFTCAEMPVQSVNYDYFNWWSEGVYLGKSWSVCSDPWNFYYDLIKRANLVMAVAKPSLDSTPDQLEKIGTTLCYRALAYMDLIRLYEYKATGFPQLDDEATYGITVPLVTEYTTEDMARNNPRAPFYKMYRFIMHDLNLAEFYLQGRMPERKNDAGIGVAYGLKARLWLEMGCRFEQHPEDLATQLAHEGDEALSSYDKLDIEDFKDCYEQSARYAAKAISLAYKPVTEQEWYDLTTGFNKANDSWMWAIQYGTDDVSQTYKHFIGFLAPEALYGVANTSYWADRLIDAELYNKVPVDDWRHYTWIDPDDAGKESGYRNYKTHYSAKDWTGFSALAGFKFRPGSGDINNYKVGNAVDVPLMRVEEMYLIRAEAVARARGYAEGQALLEDFLNTYRYNMHNYRSKATSLDEFIIEVLDQKRIELWGEGLVFWDYKRTGRAIVRDYAGSNHPSTYQMHTREGYAAPWSNFVIPRNEEQYNFGLTSNNPDPSNVHD